MDPPASDGGKRPALCEKTGPKIREEINKIFSPDNVLKFLPNEKVREAISSVRWSPGVDGKNNFLIYVSGRPGYLLMPTMTWLNKNNFPIGMIALLGDLPGDPADNKINFLSKFLNGLNNEIDFVFVFEDDYRTMKKYEEKFSAINGLAMIDNINPDKLLDMKKAKS